jgi:two-component system OmpR family response regulator
MLSALGDVDHRVSGLQHGADDYLAKPFSFVELAARVEALHRRDTKSEATTLQIADLHLDLISHQVKRGEQIIELWPLEYRLLEYLMRNADRVVTRNMLLEHVWNLSFDPQTNVVEVHMSRLRGKIDKGFTVRLIQTVRGEGYVLRAD